MKYFKVFKKGDPDHFSIMKEDAINKLKENKKIEIEIGDEVDENGYTKSEAKEFRKFVAKEKRK